MKQAIYFTWRCEEWTEMNLGELVDELFLEFEILTCNVNSD